MSDFALRGSLTWPHREAVSQRVVEPVLGCWILAACAMAATHAGPSRGAELGVLVAVVAGGYLLRAKHAWIFGGLGAGGYGFVTAIWGGDDRVVAAGWFAATVVVVLAAVTSLRAALMSALVTLAGETRTDDVTGLVNRKGFDDLSAHEVARCRRSGLPLALLCVDLDPAEAGDLVGEVGLVLATQKRGSDVLARIADEQFAVLLPGCGVDDAVRRAEHIRSLVERTSAAWPRQVTVSVGVTVIAEGTNDVRDAIGEAIGEAGAASRGNPNTVTMSRAAENLSRSGGGAGQGAAS